VPAHVGLLVKEADAVAVVRHDVVDAGGVARQVDCNRAAAAGQGLANLRNDLAFPQFHDGHRMRTSLMNPASGPEPVLGVVGEDLDRLLGRHNTVVGDEGVTLDGLSPNDQFSTRPSGACRIHAFDRAGRDFLTRLAGINLDITATGNPGPSLETVRRSIRGGICGGAAGRACQEN
jgi:hypothetical protein